VVFNALMTVLVYATIRQHSNVSMEKYVSVASSCVTSNTTIRLDTSSGHTCISVTILRIEHA
jgi:hypothetical protein